MKRSESEEMMRLAAALFLPAASRGRFYQSARIELKSLKWSYKIRGDMGVIMAKAGLGYTALHCINHGRAEELEAGIRALTKEVIERAAKLTKIRLDGKH